MEYLQPASRAVLPIVRALGEQPLFRTGARVRIGNRMPIGHYRVPLYLRGKTGVIASIIEPANLNNEEEGFGRNAGSRRHYYRVGFPMAEIWTNYPGQAQDRLFIEVFETWLEGA